MVEGEATKAGLTLGLALRNAACLNSIEELAVVPSAVAFLYVVAAGCVGILWSQMRPVAWGGITVARPRNHYVYG